MLFEKTNPILDKSKSKKAKNESKSGIYSCEFVVKLKKQSQSKPISKQDERPDSSG